jgi:hypothetical protein
MGITVFQVLAATQRPGLEGKRWFQGTADAVRQFDWLFDVRFLLVCEMYARCLAFQQCGWYETELFHCSVKCTMPFTNFEKRKAT